MDLTAEAIDRLVRLGESKKTAEAFYLDETHAHYMINDGKTWTKEAFLRESPDLSYEFYTLEGLIDYLNGSDKAGKVFVGKTSICADLSFEKHRQDEARIELVYSCEFRALDTNLLAHWASQKDFWRLLIGELHGCFLPALLGMVGQVKVAESRKSDVTIDDTGITSGSEASSVLVSFPGKKNDATEDARIAIDWTFHGRLWECFDTEYDIPMRLELQTGDTGLVFRFVAIGLDKVLRTGRDDMVKALSAGANPNKFSVYEGRARDGV